MTLNDFGVKYYRQRFRIWAGFFLQIKHDDTRFVSEKYLPRGGSKVTWFGKCLKMLYEYSEAFNRRSMNNWMVKRNKNKNTSNGRQNTKQKTKDSAAPNTQRRRGWIMCSRRVSISSCTKVNLILVHIYESLTCLFATFILFLLCFFFNLCKSH